LRTASPVPLHPPGPDPDPAQDENENENEAPMHDNVTQCIATLSSDRMVNTIKYGDFGAMMLDISNNTDILNATLEDMYHGLLSVKANDEYTPT
jgi:hypothetical protein